MITAIVLSLAMITVAITLTATVIVFMSLTVMVAAGKIVKQEVLNSCEEESE